MRVLIFASLLFAAAPAASQTFIDQIDGGSALVCSNDSGEWVCKPISVEEIRALGFTDVEGTILIDEPEEETEEEVKKCRVVE
jgi:myo-inositol catabolism protein IolC